MFTNRAAIQKVADGTESLRGLYPQFNAAKSFLESIDPLDSHEPNFSIISERQFEFDDVVTNSQAYRRVWAQKLRAKKRETTLGDGETNEATTSSRPSGNEGNGTPGANQSRKINASFPLRAAEAKSKTPASSTPHTALEDSGSQASTLKDPYSFAQQFRGYLDHVEGELQNSAKETSRLREILEKRESEAEGLRAQIQLERDRANSTKSRLENALSDNDRLREKLDELKMEFDMDLWLSEESFAKRFAIIDSELIATKESLKTANAAYTNVLEKYQATNHELYVMMERAGKMAKSLEQSLLNRGTAQFGRIALVPLQSPAGFDAIMKIPPLFQVVNAPENPDGTVARWDGEFSKPNLFVQGKS
jgi:hypothetical protein